MTADPFARRRATRAGAVLAGLGAIVLIVVAVVAVSTLRNSREGVAPEIDERTVVEFPDTPNAAVAVVDDLDRLTALAIAVLDPSGTGGSLVTVPVNVDRTSGFGGVREPVSRRPFRPGNDDDALALIAELEPVLSITIERALVLGPDDLFELLSPYTPLQVDVPQRVEDSDTPGSGFVVGAGDRTVDAEQLVGALTAISIDESSYEQHDVDVAMWRGVAATLRGSDVVVERDDDGRPLPPADADELLDRLLAGRLGVRDMAIDPVSAASADNDSGADFVLIDRLDTILVFGAVSPGLVSTPGEALTLQLVVGFDDDDVSALGVDADGTQLTKASVTRRLIGDILFGGADVRSVDLAESPSSVPETTTLVLADAGIEDAARAISELYFEDAEVRVPARVIDGVDVQVILGLDFLDKRAEQLAFDLAVADDLTEVDGESPGADFDASELSVEEASADDQTGTVDEDG
ncbi:MAG: hypothetical protein AB8G26_10220 [Ilumatobacter sp.]